MSQIAVHLRRGVFPAARLATMAVTVSAVAVVTVVTAGAAFSVAPLRADDPARGPLEETGCKAEVRGAFVFSFGLEQGSRVFPDCPARGVGG